MVVRSVSDSYLEIEFDPTCDLRSIVQIASICGGTTLTGVCKVSVIFVRGDLTSEVYNENFRELREAYRERQMQATLFPAESAED